MRNHNGKKNSSMLWMMLVCVIPILALLFLGGWLSRGNSWIFPVAMGVFVLAHFILMFRGHGGHGDANSEDKSDTATAQEPKAKDKHQHGGCYH